MKLLFCCHLSSNTVKALFSSRYIGFSTLKTAEKVIQAPLVDKIATARVVAKKSFEQSRSNIFQNSILSARGARLKKPKSYLTYVYPMYISICYIGYIGKVN